MLEDVKRLLKRHGLLIVVLLVIVVAGSIALGKKDSEKKTEEVWEPLVIIEGKEPEAEDEVIIENAEEYYTESTVDNYTESSAEMFVRENQEPVSVLSAEEEQNLRDEAVSAAEQCMELYRNAEISDPQTSYSYIADFSDEQRKSVVECLGGQGVVSVSDDINMENHQKVEEFYSVYAAGSDAMVTIFDVYKSGNIGALTFIHRSGRLQTYYVTIGWQEGGIPQIKDFGSSDLEEIKMTEKGYLIYTYTETVMHGNLREYYRVKPLSDECRELTQKYIYGLSFVNYNMLVTNWDAGNVEEILLPRMFEDIYRVYTKEPLQIENGMISAEIYERVMTTCFPVSIEQVREYCGYHADTDSYEYEMIFSRQFPPFGEVVDYKRNEDGTITLYVDGVWPDYNSDYAFTNRIVVCPFADGTFRYLSNSIEQKELEIPREEKSYGIPVSDSERTEAEADCKKMMGLISELYRNADKGHASNVIISDETMYRMAVSGDINISMTEKICMS